MKTSLARYFGILATIGGSCYLLLNILVEAYNYFDWEFSTSWWIVKTILRESRLALLVFAGLLIIISRQKGTSAPIICGVSMISAFSCSMVNIVLVNTLEPIFFDSVSDLAILHLSSQIIDVICYCLVTLAGITMITLRDLDYKRFAGILLGGSGILDIIYLSILFICPWYLPDFDIFIFPTIGPILNYVSSVLFIASGIVWLLPPTSIRARPQTQPSSSP